jgi:hypothetical protein
VPNYIRDFVYARSFIFRNTFGGFFEL